MAGLSYFSVKINVSVIFSSTLTSFCVLLGFISTKLSIFVYIISKFDMNKIGFYQCMLNLEVKG